MNYLRHNLSSKFTNKGLSLGRLLILEMLDSWLLILEAVEPQPLRLQRLLQ